MSPRPLSVAVLTVALAAVACGAPGTGGAAAGPAPAPPAAAPGSAPVEAFELPSLDGDSFRFDPADARLTLIDFWATWCSPCREEVPFLKELQERYADRGFRLVAISDESASQIREFVEANGIEYTNLVDADGEVGSVYRVVGLPTGYLVDADGNVVWSMPGRKNEKALEETIASFLGADDGAS